MTRHTIACFALGALAGFTGSYTAAHCTARALTRRRYMKGTR